MTKTTSCLGGYLVLQNFFSGVQVFLTLKSKLKLFYYNFPIEKIS